MGNLSNLGLRSQVVANDTLSQNATPPRPKTVKDSSFSTPNHENLKDPQLEQQQRRVAELEANNTDLLKQFNELKTKTELDAFLKEEQILELNQVIRAMQRTSLIKEVDKSREEVVKA